MNASNGNTQVFINGREIKKVEYSDTADVSRELGESSSAARDLSSHKEKSFESCRLGFLRRAPVVSFCDVESDEVFTGELHDDLEVIETFGTKKIPEQKVPERCMLPVLKGGIGLRKRRFALYVMQSTVVIVCSERWGRCQKEGNASLALSVPIDESKRKHLGKSSRLLKRLLNELEIRHIIKTEKLYDANQLPPEHICINGEPLSHDELALLQSCTDPPKKKKEVPGRYWYDKVSGLWGKEVHKPSRIITPHLNVGGPIQMNASNGYTQVFINGREIKKVELRMLQLAGVQCVGSYLEEGQKNPKGYIWGKAGTKLVCALLSLTVPSKSSSSAKQVNNVLKQGCSIFFGRV